MNNLAIVYASFPSVTLGALLWMDELLDHLSPGIVIPLQIASNNGFLWFHSGAKLGLQNASVIMLWMVEIEIRFSHHEMKPWLKPLFVDFATFFTGAGKCWVPGCEEINTDNEEQLLQRSFRLRPPLPRASAAAASAAPAASAPAASSPASPARPGLAEQLGAEAMVSHTHNKEEGVWSPGGVPRRTEQGLEKCESGGKSSEVVVHDTISEAKVASSKPGTRQQNSRPPPPSPPKKERKKEKVLGTLSWFGLAWTWI